MEKEKCIIPSVVSLHVRALDEKEPLKNLFNCSDNSTNRRLSYNLVRIYNTSYNSIRNKPVSENLPPYLANVTSHTHSLNSSVINCRFNSLLKRTNNEYPSLFPNNRPHLVSQFWSNSMKNHQSEENLVSKRCTSPLSDTDSQKNHRIINDCQMSYVTTRNSVDNSIIKQGTPLKKKSNISIRLEQVQEDSLFLPSHTIISKSKPLESQDRISALNNCADEVLTESRTNSIKSQNNKFQNSSEKSQQRKLNPSILHPIKERAATANFDSSNNALLRCPTSICKASISTSLKSNSPSLVVSEINKAREGSAKRNNSPLVARLINTQSNFMSNTQFFPYPDPCEVENSGQILSRLNEMTALESETVRWEKTKNVKRRPRLPIESSL